MGFMILSVILHILDYQSNKMKNYKYCTVRIVSKSNHRGGCDRIIVGCITTYGISAYQH